MRTSILLGTVLCVLVHQSLCDVTLDKRQEDDVSVAEARAAIYHPRALPLNNAVTSEPAPEARALETADDFSEFEEEEEEGRQHNIHIKKKKKKLKKKLKKSSKVLKKLLPFLLIPLLIQAKLIPLFLFKLKLLALKAFGIGKLALILVAINLGYTYFMNKGHTDADQQYSQDAVASEHYGYNGGSEVGAWVNKRVFNAPQS